ncbi:MAG: hypothetical protein COA79_26625 [Planctomycetota bacterium]|nr:MAG: hypothetical protein COA79_26625 [Planctomycetota bacterium]
MNIYIKKIVYGFTLIILGFVFGLGGTILGMISSFDNMASKEGIATPQILAEGISNSLIYPALGIPVALIGLFLMIYGIEKYLSNRNIELAEKIAV